ncbi:hypothetical protein CLOBY_16540 [Clostridium saccharobutylicum]|uniref:hypothetical protein n=2 Tax=Clostridium saccharobutylicum TaxID=169679 RepID=UPI0004213D84|nr:hypothetical protein [Clostridium saccharobutylicum]AQR89893.1 hypothetical protein CLOSC_15980 [Clostridium saccharobutylicum]AQR99797.1 hypothetical protein CSACC_16060 [Clostridium saccharobutylicum]AQS09525.1 hypothetical protein CLOBY_16540 [Clostridium saccharobutylicum]AQS13781.1 hypothetical protein CLOSACC_16060 [Clostridium saccharobutylicum]MBA2904815.1 hypothetical protein [Clostridium saccharobutylicum]
MAANSNDLMSNSNSYYSRFYEFDSRYRKKQNLTSSKEAAETIANIILKKRLNARYKVAVPFTYNIVAHLPDFLREYIMKKRK